MDVVVICKNSVTQLDEISWFRNDSILSFESEAVPLPSLTFSPGSIITLDILQINNPKSLSLGDVDQDGDLDLAVASSQDGNFSLLLNDL